MGAEYYSSSICWCTQQKLNLDAGIKLAEAIQDKEEREKVLEALSNIPRDQSYYSREGEVTKAKKTANSKAYRKPPKSRPVNDA